jgi:hypothetical protein
MGLIKFIESCFFMMTCGLRRRGEGKTINSHVSNGKSYDVAIIDLVGYINTMEFTDVII